jgi:hypothetical protein
MIRGRCACAAVRFEVGGSFHEAHHCHCSVCRRSHGAAFATFACTRTSSLRVVEGEASIATYRSSEPVRRSFCRTCGSSLFFAHDAAPHLVWVAVGSLDDASAAEVAIDAHCFVGSKAPWWTIADGLAQHAEQRPELTGKAQA